MKTHEVAKALTHLARILRAGPNIPMEDVGNLGLHSDAHRQPRPTRKSPEVAEKETGQKGAALALLAKIASYSKLELVQLSGDLSIPGVVKNTDSVRDLLGRTLKYIADNPSAQERLVGPSSDKGAPSQPSALARALAILMSQP
jgi:hypothetical protein